MGIVRKVNDLTQSFTRKNSFQSERYSIEKQPEIFLIVDSRVEFQVVFIIPIILAYH